MSLYAGLVRKGGRWVRDTSIAASPSDVGSVSAVSVASVDDRDSQDASAAQTLLTAVVRALETLDVNGSTKVDSEERARVYHEGVRAVVRHREGGHLAQRGDEPMQHFDVVRCLREHHHRSLGRRLQAG